MLFVSSETEWERNYHWHSFNLGIEMLFVSSPYRRPCRPPPRMVSISESRCFSFQVRRHAPDVVPPRFSFQSRNRDAFRFKSSRNLFKKPKVDVSISESRCFSFQVKSVRRRRKEVVIVSISESRCFSFQVTVNEHIDKWIEDVSISESRCFSFQVTEGSIPEALAETSVSISESRCFSFQSTSRRLNHLAVSFNLGIEMLFVSSRSFFTSISIAV